MTRAEYELVFQAFKNYRLYMSDEQKVLSEKILDDLFYSEFDKLSNDDLVADAEQALANESKITQEMVDASLATPMWYEKESDDDGVKALNFRN